MYLDFQVKIPTESAGITRKKIEGTTYIYYAYEHNYNTKKGYTVPKNTTIGKCTEDDSELMYPNTNFLKFFPAEELPETKGSAYRSGCLRAGTYFVLRKIIAEYHLDEMLGDIIGKNSGLFLDLAVYSIIAENNAGQYYPDYAYNHPLFTDRMKIYSDTKVSDFINSITRLCQIGGAVESVLGSAIEEEDIPKLIGFLKRQEANGKFFSKATQKEPVANTEEV